MELPVREKFDSYPTEIHDQFIKIRTAIFNLSDNGDIGEITETLKWGEPSYLAKHGSTVRMDWKPKNPDQLFVYFNCKTILLETIKEIYSDIFQFSGNRAIVLSVAEEIPLAELSECISMALRYHKIKHLPMLGA